MSGQTWLADNWFTILQSLGIIGSLLFTGLSLRIDAKVRRMATLLEFTKHHREIWTLVYSHPELARVFDVDANLTQRPVTQKETVLVNMLILHLSSAYRAMQLGMATEPRGLRADIREFFALPIPKSVWQTLRNLQESDFVQFVDGVVEKRPTPVV